MIFLKIKLEQNSFVFNFSYNFNGHLTTSYNNIILHIYNSVKQIISGPTIFFRLHFDSICSSSSSFISSYFFRIFRKIPAGSMGSAFSSVSNMFLSWTVSLESKETCQPYYCFTHPDQSFLLHLSGHKGCASKKVPSYLFRFCFSLLIA